MFAAPRAKRTTRQQIWLLFSDPTSSPLARLIAGIVLAMIILSVVAFVIQVPTTLINGL